MMTDPKKHKEINDLLTGPPTTRSHPTVTVVPTTADEIPAPSWWRGDDDAYTSAQVAVAQAASRR